ncbi:hypothetical protein [Pectobacterium sp. B2J-2]|uniref:ParE family toxin-like protein n=1 Tax=Pectobacterium sp. B2J-2 TaxID=3385372 RepID=UPI0038FD3702
MAVAEFHLCQCASPCVLRKATRLITAWQRGERVYKRLQTNGYLKIDIGPFWRLLSKDGGGCWHLMSHETYNREIKK